MRLTVVACLLVTGLAPAGPPHFEDAPLRAVTFADAKEGWAVGDEGVIWHTIDGGKEWERQPSGTRASLRAVQFLTPYTGFVVGRTELPNRAGSVGVLLSTSDGGVTWTQMTGTLLPGLNAVQFFDDKRGVAAGDGSDVFPNGVFRTDDGGRSWKMLPGPRAGSWVMADFKTPDIGYLKTEDGSADVTGGMVGPFHRTDLNVAIGADGKPVARLSRMHAITQKPAPTLLAGEFGTIARPSADGPDAVCRCGGQRAAVLFALKRSADVPLGAVTALAADGYLCAAGAEDADADYRLPAAMRLAGGAGALRGKLADLVDAYKPDVIVTDLPTDGLKAAKVYTLAAGPGDGVVSLNLTAYVPELGESPRDAAESACLLFGPTPQPDVLHFKLVGGTLADAKGHTSLMQGIDLGEGGTARRKKPAAADASRETVATSRRELEKMLGGPPTAETVSAAVNKLKTLPEADAARAGTMLGFRLAHSGQWTAARELFACVAEPYAAYPEAVEAMRWLVRFHTSGEARRRVELGHFPLMAQTGWVEEPADRIQQASFTAGLTPTPKWRFQSTEAARTWVKPAAAVQPKLAAFGTAYARDPGTAFCLATANRLLGLPARSTDTFTALAPTVAEPWAGRMGDELRLVGADKDRPAGRELACRFTRTKPFLDGKLDDACWKDAEVADGVRLLCDDQFLYVGVECKGMAGDKRPRDSDLTDRDRVEVVVDVDRDYTTAFRIAVDAAGSVSDECWGDRGWNPKLFVATAKTADGWAVELAIPLSELTGAKPTPGHPWAAGVAYRKAGDAEPAGMKLMRFMAGK